MADCVLSTNFPFQSRGNLMIHCLPAHISRISDKLENYLCIFRAECFGLLGKNGAGKSSIFKMLTGETMITSGQIFTQGFNQKYQLQQIYKVIGYCPQFDALLNGLTCRETLEIFAMLRGISSQDVKHYIENTARSLDFIQHIDKKIKQLR